MEHEAPAYDELHTQRASLLQVPAPLHRSIGTASAPGQVRLQSACPKPASHVHWPEPARVVSQTPWPEQGVLWPPGHSLSQATPHKPAGQLVHDGPLEAQAGPQKPLLQTHLAASVQTP